MKRQTFVKRKRKQIAIKMLRLPKKEPKTILKVFVDDIEFMRSTSTCVVRHCNVKKYISYSPSLSLWMFHDFIVLYVVYCCIILYCVLYFSVFYTRSHTCTHTAHTHTYTFNKHNQNILTQQLCWLYRCCIVYAYINIWYT